MWVDKNQEVLKKYLVAMADDRQGATNEQILQARRLQEVFRGRFSEDESLRLLEYKNWDLGEAFNFVHQGDPNEVRNISGAGDDWLHVMANGLITDLTIPFEIRQYGCGDCDNVWWRKVPTRKPFSKCKRCKRRFKPVPRNNEWGLGRFECPQCGSQFTGYASMEPLFYAPCYSCNTMCRPMEILPPRKGELRNIRGRFHHSCNAHDCYNRTNDGRQAPTRCVHPRSLARKVLVPSNQHHSTGSTVNTFLTQGDLGEIYFGPSDPDISEEGSDEHDGHP